MPDEQVGTWAAGWYPDPLERAPLRWWDGDAWSGQTSDGRAVAWDPSPLDAPIARDPGLPGLGIALVGAVVGFALASAIGAALAAADDPGARTAELALSSLGLWSALVGTCVLVSRRRGTGSLVRDLGFRFRRIDIGLGFAGALAGRLVAGMVLAPIPIFPTRNLREVDESVLEDGIHGATAWIVIVLVVCVGAPLVEELFFRGLLQPRLVTRLGPTIGIGVASLVFGAAHLVAWEGPITLAYGWSIAGAGLVLGLVRHHAGRLGPAIAAHAIFNAQAMLVLWLVS
jgi:membrane protease YdiL (CAAX protease family)